MIDPDAHIRAATPADLPTILMHRRQMFRDMGVAAEAQLAAMAAASESWLAAALADGRYRGWLAETAEGRVVAGGGVIVEPWLARPEDADPRQAVIVNMYTEPEWRGRDLARRLMLTMIEALRAEGLGSVVLHASDAGRHLYETLGFVPTNQMRLVLR